MGKKIVAADLFCGAGGTSTGLAIACREAGRKVDLLGCRSMLGLANGKVATA